MAALLNAYPEAKRTDYKSEDIEDRLVVKFEHVDDGTFPSLSGSYVEKGDLVLFFLNVVTRRWLEVMIATFKLLSEENKLIIGLSECIRKSTRLFLRAHLRPLKRFFHQL